MKDAPNHIPMNMIGSAHNSCEILEDGDDEEHLVMVKGTWLDNEAVMA